MAGVVIQRKTLEYSLNDGVVQAKAERGKVSDDTYFVRVWLRDRDEFVCYSMRPGLSRAEASEAWQEAQLVSWEWAQGPKRRPVQFVNVRTREEREALHERIQRLYGVPGP